MTQTGFTTLVVQVPITASNESHTRVESKESWVVLEYRAHNDVCLANCMAHEMRRWTAYSREMLAAALLPWWTSCVAAGRRPDTHEIAAKVQPYLSREVGAGSAPVTGVVKKLSQFTNLGRGYKHPQLPTTSPHTRSYTKRM